MIARLFAIALVFAATSIAFLVLGGVTTSRTFEQSQELGPEVADLWGRPHQQDAPVATFRFSRDEDVSRTETEEGKTRIVNETVTRWHEKAVPYSSTDVAADIVLDQRLKGLMWYSLYNVAFDATWQYTHREAETGFLRLVFRFPDASGLFDGFQLAIDGQDRAAPLQPENGAVSTEVPVSPGQTISVKVSYRSRGLDEWRYMPSAGVASLENFACRIRTSFSEIDYPVGTLSPSSRQDEGDGWVLGWDFSQVVTGRGIGVLMPSRLQPGELSTSLSVSAPVSLFFFFLVLFALGTMKKIDLHPVNYLFLAGAFFAFHLLFAYSVDRLAIAEAFTLSSLVSVALVISYLRLAVGSRFAFVEAGFAQLVYLVGFSLAHFWKGYTGLTVTVLSIVTLGLLMQLTGRVRWTDALSAGAKSRQAAGQTPETSALA